MKTKSVLLILFLATTFFSNAQKLLTVDEAIEIALKNNYDIKVATNDAEIAKINNTLGNAGMLPTMEITGSGNTGVANTYQKLQNGTENNYNSVLSTSLNAGIQLNWTLFDGGKMFVTKSKLNEIESLGDLQFKEKVLSTTYQIVAAYYNVVRQKQLLVSINEVINYNQERVKINQTGFEAGSILKSDWLQWRIDLNVLLENAISQKFAISSAKKDLNVLLARNPDEDFEVNDSISTNYSPEKPELLNKLSSANMNILMLQKQVDISRLSLKENQRNYFPIINLKGGYYVGQNENSKGSTLSSNSFGPEVGGTISIPLYSAGENKRKMSTAKYELSSAETDLQQVKLQLTTDLENAFTEMENQKKLLEIETENNELAKENLEISLQRLRLGQTTSLEVRLVQSDYVQAATRLIDFQYNLKIAETKLKQLVSEL